MFFLSFLFLTNRLEDLPHRVSGPPRIFSRSTALFLLDTFSPLLPPREKWPSVLLFGDQIVSRICSSQMPAMTIKRGPPFSLFSSPVLIFRRPFFFRTAHVKLVPDDLIISSNTRLRKEVTIGGMIGVFFSWGSMGFPMSPFFPLSIGKILR